MLLGLAALGGAAAAGSAGRALAGATPVRRDVATLSARDIAALEYAVGEMQRRSRRDPDDPAGWLANAVPHEVACSGRGPLKVHGTWWFLPWHRAFLHATERKLQAIAGDPGLRIPYWDWSSDRRIPEPFRREGSPLAAARRFTPDRPLRATEVGFAGHDPALARLGVTGLHAERFVAAGPNDIPSSFGGVPDTNPGGWHGRSAIEGVPHAALHNYVGGRAADGTLGDMTELSTAALDPVFLLHHANLDRLWEAWRADPARRASIPRAAEFLDRPFLFTQLDGTPLPLTARTLLEGDAAPGYDRLAVLRAAPPAPDPAAAAAGKPLAVTLPALRPGQRTDLILANVLTGDRPVTAEVLLDAGHGPLAVGAVAIGRRAGPPSYPDTEWRYDVTTLVRAAGPGNALIQLAPLRLGPNDPPPPAPEITASLAVRQG